MKKVLFAIIFVLSCLMSFADEPFRQARYDGFKVLSPAEGSIVMIGNSITDQHIWNEVFRDAQGKCLPISNRGNSGSYATAQAENIESYIANKPAKVFMMIGTNDIATSGGLSTPSTPEVLLSYVKSIVTRIHKRSPKTEVYLYPIINNNTSNRVKATWLAYNELLQQWITEVGESWLTYIDFYDDMECVGNGGAWSNDALHPNAAGYKKWATAIKGYLGTGVTSAYDLIEGDLTAEQSQTGLSSMNGARATMFSVMPITTDDILIFGDSEIKTAEWWELLGNNNVKNRGTGWGNSGSVATTLKVVQNTFTPITGITKATPKAIFLYTGTDYATGSTSIDTVAKYYGGLIDTIKAKAPGAPIYVMGIHPRYNNDALNTGSITTYNTWLKETLAAGDASITYVDTYTPLLSGNSASSDYVNGNQYLTGKGSVLFANAMATAINAKFTGLMNPVSVDDANTNYTMANLRNQIGTKITAGRDVVASDKVGGYTEAAVTAYNNKVEEAYTLLDQTSITSEEATAMVSAMTAALNEVNAPTAANTTDKCFTLNTPNRGSRYLTSNGAGATMTGEAWSGYDTQVWKLQIRENGTFDVVNANDGTYMTTTSPISTSKTAPTDGWTFKNASTAGLFVITNGTNELNQQNGSPYNILNWGGGSNLSDAGCMYAINEIDASAYKHQTLFDGHYYTIAGYIARNGGTYNYVSYDGSARATSHDTPAEGDNAYVWKAVKSGDTWKFQSMKTANAAYLTYAGVDATGAAYTITDGVATGAVSMKINGVWSASSEAGEMGGGWKSSSQAVQNDNTGWSTDWILTEVAEVEPDPEPLPEDATGYAVNGTTGTNNTSSFYNKWQSTATNEDGAKLITLQVGPTARNNMKNTSTGNLMLYRGGYSDCQVYTISAAAGYNVVGYSIKFKNVESSYNVTLTPNGRNGVTAVGSESAQLDVTGLKAASTTFTLSTAGNANKGAELTEFTVYLTEALVRSTVYDSQNGPIYRIPAIAQSGTDHTIVAICDERPGGGDIGYGEVDIKYRYSTDNGKTWSDEGYIANGTASTEDLPNYGFGDAAVVGDRESENMLLMCVNGKQPWPSSTRTSYTPTARFRSTDGGKTWSEPEFLEDYMYTLFDGRSSGYVAGIFFGSGRIHQSRYYKKDQYYRLYAVLCARPGGNLCVYSDDFGETWAPLGGKDALPCPSGDEPKAEELPDGRVILSSRVGSGRLFNIYTFTDVASGAGYWQNEVKSQQSTNGVLGSNACNGEILVVPAKRVEDNKPCYLALQSVPTRSGARADVGIFYKELADATDMTTVTQFASDWDGFLQVSETTSGYSTMILQSNDKVGFWFEENSCHGGAGYDEVYIPLTIEKITANRYTLNRSLEEGDAHTAYLQSYMPAIVEATPTGNYVGQTTAEAKASAKTLATSSCANAQNVAAVFQTIESGVKVIEEGKTYRILNTTRGGDGAYAITLGDGKMVAAATNATSAAQQFTFVPVEGQTGKWYIKASNDEYFGKLGANETETSNVTTTDEAGIWNIQSTIDGITTFCCTNKTGSNAFIHMSGDNTRLVPWTATAPSQWRLVEVEEAEEPVTLVTPTNFSILTDGAYVSLQCRDTNGGAGYYFNGNTTKSAELSYDNIYQLTANGTGLSLKRVKDSKYVTTDMSQMSDDLAGAAVFTLAIKGTDDFTYSSTTEIEGTVRDNLVRFTVAGTSNFLNCNNANLTPKYAGGTGGFSAWYVYKYSQAKVDELANPEPEPTSYTYTVNNTTCKTFRSGSESTSFCSVLKTNDSPQVTLSATANNMQWSGENIAIYTGGSSHTYTLSAPEGYIIDSYSFTATNISGNTADMTLTIGGKTYHTLTAQQIASNIVNSQSVQIVEAGENKGVVLSDFTVTIKKDVPELPKLTTEEETHWYYITSAAASTVTYCTGKVMYADKSDDNRMRFADKKYDPSYIWCFKQNAEGKYAIQNYNGLYMGTAPTGTGGSTTFCAQETANYIYNITDAYGYFIIKDENVELHAQQSGNRIVRWTSGEGNASLWRFNEVDCSEPETVVNTNVQQGRVTTGIGNKNLPIVRSTVSLTGLVGDHTITGLKGTVVNKGNTTGEIRIYAASNARELVVDAIEGANDVTWREANGTLLATTTVAEDGTFDTTFDAQTVTLAQNGYFWVVLDIAETAEEGATVDATITGYTIDGNEVAEESGNPANAATIFLSEGTVLLPKDKGVRKDVGSTFYRIPAITMVKMQKDGESFDRLVTLTDDRLEHDTDLPSHCYLVAQYSDDMGKTWSEPKVVAGTAETGGDYGHGDASLVTNRDNGEITGIMVSSGTYGHGFWAGTAEQPARWRTITSTDGGETWSTPHDFTDDLYGANAASHQNWLSGFSGSGAALQKRDGTLVSSYVNRETNDGTTTQNFYFFMSKDGGKHWYVSGTSGTTAADEPKTLERNNGDLAISVRAGGYNFHNVSTDNGKTWQNAAQTRFTSGISGNACDGEYMVWCSSVEGNEVADGVGDIAFITCPNNGGRQNLSIALSTDEGETFGTPKTICPSKSAYSAATILSDGTLGLYYEEGGVFGDYTMRFVRFSLDWASNNAYSFKDVPFKPIRSTRADVDGDGDIDVDDVNKAVEDAQNGVETQHEYTESTRVSDVDYDGKVTVTDATKVVDAGKTINN